MAKRTRRRLNYFKYQFLEAEDFKAEQDYHLEMRRLHNQLLHTAGVVDGLVVTKKDDTTINVSPGVAIDNKGQEIILESGQDVSLGDHVKYPSNSEIFVVICYQEEEDKDSGQPKDKVIGYTRLVESGLVEAKTQKPLAQDPIVLLAHFSLASDKVPGNVNGRFEIDRQLASAKISPRSITLEQLVPSSERFVSGTKNDGEIISPPTGTTINDWEIFVSLKELSVKKSGAFISDFKIEVSTQVVQDGWKIRCYSKELPNGVETKGTANYLLTRR